MAGSFQPKFVDLVRNATSTTGTGNFTLGPAVSGFNSFAGTVLAGEQFYYSATNSDKPNEREIGRGTMQSNGTIARDPINGTKTSFTAGAKSVALIAAAEWFERVQSGGGGSIAVADRAALASAPTSGSATIILSEAGREGTFVFDPSDLSARVTSDPRGAMIVAPAAAPSGSAGAWVRSHSGPLNVRWFGAKGDGVADDHSAFAAAIAFAGAQARDIAGRGVPEVFVPAGIYRLGANPIDITYPVSLIGENGRGTLLAWTSGSAGIRVQHGNTSGSTAVQGDSGIRPFARIANLTLDGGYAGGAESEAPAIHLRSATSVEDLLIQNWPGDGIFLCADTSNAAMLGNANMANLRNIMTSNCRRGIYAKGLDANACGFDNVRGFANRQWAIHDGSFLGNTYRSPLAESNARTPQNDGQAVACSYVSHGGNRYFCMPGQEAWASVNAPSGTAAHNLGWGYWQPGGADAASGVPAWSSGIKVRPGGGYFIEGPSNRTKLENPYCEDSEISLIDQCGFIDGAIGMNFSWRLSGGTLLGRLRDPTGPGAITTSADGLELGGAIKTTGNLHIASGSLWIGPQTGAANSDVYFENSGNFNSLWYRSWAAGVPQSDGLILSAKVNAGMRIYGRGEVRLGTLSGGSATDVATIGPTGLSVTGTIAASGAVSGSNLSGTNSGDQFTAIGAGTLVGRSTGGGSGPAGPLTAAQAKTLLAIGAADVGGLAPIAASGSGSDLTAASVTFAKLQNVAGARLLGNAGGSAASASEIGLSGGLTFSGSNLSLGAITPTSVAASGAVTSSGGAIGYATGAGGAATQATSKSTAVTVNAPSGQITTNNAALAAAALATFTVNNSQVAATDTINLNLRSGNATAGTYRYWVEGVAAGSFKIVIENRSAGSLSEALIFSFALIKAVAA